MIRINTPGSNNTKIVLDLPLPEGHSCHHCQKLILDYSDEALRWRKDPLALTDEPQLETSSWTPPPKRVIKWLESIAELSGEPPKIDFIIFDLTVGEAREAATGGCTLCHTILSNCENDVQFGSFPEGHNISFDSDLFITGIVFGGITHFSVVRSYDELARTIRGSTVKPDYFNYQMIRRNKFRVTTIANDIVSTALFPTRPINTKPSSDDSFALMKMWLHTCLHNHKDCTKHMQEFTPKRLIRMPVAEDPDCVRLFEQNHGVGKEPYVALSYCWGKGSQLMTTTESLPQFLLKINLHDLPQTIKDAIRVTCNLGIQWLWVDSLCIIQDDNYDQVEQIHQMPKIYGSATLTIMASRASDVHEGFLQERSTVLKLDNPNFSLPYLPRSGQMENVILTSELSREDQIFIEPLDSRAWCLQERFLSRRILEFGSFQTRWNCQHREVVTDGFKREDSVTKQRSDRVFKQGLELLLNYRHMKFKPASRFDVWGDLVKLYSHRSLSLPSDRLPAISGIASLFSNTFGDEYVAGHWRSNLARELLWTATNKPGSSRRPLDYIAPSWSWASINAGVLFGVTPEVDEHFRIIECSKQHNIFHQDSYLSFHELGLESSSFVVRGQVFPAQVYRDKIEEKTVQLRMKDNAKLTYPAVSKFDAIEDEVVKNGPGYFAVLLLRVSKPQNQKPHQRGLYDSGLILRQTSGNEYSRWGVYTSVVIKNRHPDNDRWVEQTISII